MTRLGVMLALILSAPLAARAQQPSPPAEPTVVTSGEGIVHAAPDRAWLNITAESRAANPREAQQRNADAMKPVQDKLRAAGVPADAIRTIGYDLQQEFDVVNDRRVSRGFVARNTIEVRVDAISRVGEILEVAVGSGATAVGGIRFDLKDRAGLEREALKLAVADARARAEAVAAGTGRSIERILRIEERGVQGGPMPYVAAGGVALRAQADVPIAVGQLEVRAQVTLTAVLK
jgi:uncharacterized protein YggE